MATDKNPNSPNRKLPPVKFNLYWLYSLIALIFIGLYFFNGQTPTKEVNWSEFERITKGGGVERIVIYSNKSTAEAYLNDSTAEKVFKAKRSELGKAPAIITNISSSDNASDAINKWQEEGLFKGTVQYEKGSDIMDLVWSVGPFVLLIFFWFFIMRRMSGGGAGGAGNVFSVGKAKAQLFDKEGANKTSFKDVAGLSEAKQEVEEIVEFLKKPSKFTDLGGKIPKGALLVGPPGTGKTLLAKAVAGEANVPFFSLSGSDFVEMFVGVGASRVRDLFRQAKEKAPCIVFIDEIDAVGRARGKNPNMGANDERENTLNQLLTEMDGFGSNSGVIILAATNRADILDKALLRAGRFDRQIYVELPDLNDRKAIFKVHLANVKIDKALDIELLARQTPGFSGADIANVCNEAALIAARHNKKAVEKQDFMDAVDRIVGGLEKKNKITTTEEKRAIAVHESGHALLSWYLQYASPLVKVTIVPRGKALGAAWYLPEERQITTREQMLDEMCATLGGRAAEEVFLGRISTGAANDLERVTKLAYAMIAYYGMSDTLSNLSYYDSSGQEYGFSKPYSDETARLIDKEVHALISSQYNRAKEMLNTHRDGHQQLTDILVEREVIFAEDVEAIFGKRPWASRSEEILASSSTNEVKSPEITLQKITEQDTEILNGLEKIYLEAFPPDERREWNDVVALLSADRDFELSTITTEGQVIGFFSYWKWNTLAKAEHFSGLTSYFPANWEWKTVAYVEHFAIAPTQRGGGCGSIALQQLLTQLACPVVIEVEPEVEPLAARRIDFYRRNGFTLWETPYTQPPYRPDSASLEMRLMAHGALSPEAAAGIIKLIHSEVYNA